MRRFLTLYMTVNWHREFAVNFATFLKVCSDFFHFCTVIFVQPYTALVGYLCRVVTIIVVPLRCQNTCAILAYTENF